MSNKDKFIQIYEEFIKREGADELLDYLTSSKSDFFTAPASSKFHGSYEGGLCEHSLNVYECLTEYLKRQRVKDVYGLNYDEESIAIVALLHDVCKINLYKKTVRNKKDEDTGKWYQVDAYEVDDDLPYGHGEKSVYILSGFIKLNREEAFSIRYHMGFSGTEPIYNVGKAFSMYPLSFATSLADMESTYFLEK
ncbi:MAG: HD domain-containing protein [Oscillospiraceae bacterium]